MKPKTRRRIPKIIRKRASREHSRTALIRNFWWVAPGVLLLLLSLYSPFARQELKECQSLYHKAQEFYEKRKFEDSLYSLRLLYSSFPFCPKAPKALLLSSGIYRFHLKDLRKSRELFSTVKKRYPGTPYAQLAKIWLEEKQYPLLRKLSSGYPSVQPAVERVMFQACSELSDLWLPTSAYLAITPHEKEKSFLFFQAKKGKCRNKSTAISLFQKIMQSNPSSDEGLMSRLELADLYFQKGKLKKARLLLEPVPDKFASYFHAGLGDLFFEAHSHEKALSSYQKALGLSALSTPFFSRLPPSFQRVRVLYRIQKEEEARKAVQHFFSKALKLLQQAQQGSEGKIREELNKLSALLAEELVKQGNIEDSLEVLKYLVFPVNSSSISRETEDALFLTVRLLAATGSRNKASRLLDKLSKLSLSSRRLLLHRLMLQPERIEQVLPAVKQAWEKEDPFSFLGYYAYVRFKLKRLSGTYPLYVYVRLEQEIAQRVSPKIRASLKHLKASDVPKEIILFDLYAQEGQYARALAVLPGKERPLFSFYLNLIHTRPGKPETLTEARVWAEHVSEKQKELERPSSEMLDKLLDFLQSIHREDLIPVNLKQLQKDHPALSYRFYIRQMRELLEELQSLVRNKGAECLEPQVINQLETMALSLFLHRADQIPARKERLARKIGAEVSQEAWKSITEGMLFPEPPEALLGRHNGLAHLLQQWVREVKQWQSFCTASLGQPLDPEALQRKAQVIAKLWKKIQEEAGYVSPSPL